MKARCGRCGTEFEVVRPGRYACPACGVTNEVRGGAPPNHGAGMPPGPHEAGPQGPMSPPPAPPSEPPSRRVVCPDEECGFSFIVGAVAVVPCPMCGSEVNTDTRAGRRGRTR